MSDLKSGDICICEKCCESQYYFKSFCYVRLVRQVTTNSSKWKVVILSIVKKPIDSRPYVDTDYTAEDKLKKCTTYQIFLRKICTEDLLEV